MRVALVVPGGVDRAGEHRVIPAILWLLERLTRRHDVHVVVPFQEERPASWTLRGATVHNVGRPLRGARDGFGGERAAVRTLEALHRHRPFDLFQAFWARGPGEVAWIAARRCRRPLAVHVAGGELVWMPDVPFGARRAWTRALARHVVRRADRVTVASRSMAALVEEAGGQAARVLLGVDTELWRPTPPRPRPGTRPARLVHVGSLTPVKDHPTLLRAVARLRDAGRGVHLDLVGEDTSGGRVPDLVRRLGLAESVSLHGFLPQRRASAVVRGADLMVVSSRHEAGPVAFLEAAAVGVPTVGSDLGHVRDFAPEAAVAVRPGDAGALAAGVASLLDDEPGRLAVARAAQAIALEHDADWTCARFEALWLDMTTRA